MSNSRARLTAPSAEAAADAIIERLSGHIVLGLPLGLGKANLIANALYARAAADPSISLTILTALTLETPRGANELHERFLAPLRKRIFAGCPDQAYVAARRAGTLPPNIKVHEFFLLAGRWLSSPSAQQDYICANYTEAAEVLLARGMNVIAQMARREGEDISLSCNADLTPDLLAARRRGHVDLLFAAEINSNLPFMNGDARLSLDECDIVLETPETAYRLFAPPKPPVSEADYGAGLWISRLIPDGGTLQIGIGSIGDAVAQALILRNAANDDFRALCSALAAGSPDIADSHDGPFEEGLFGLSEMLVDSFLPLIEAGVVKREVDGALIHAAFFLGPQSFYEALLAMDPALRAKIEMRPVTWVNSLYRDEDRKRTQRNKARFINNAMMATLTGAVISDGLEDGRVVSGVGGQYDFIAQSFALEGARSIIALNATRMKRGEVRSNIVWSYGHETIPRHLRDIVVTEYGVADLRGKSDAETIAAMLAVTDSRFQPGLLAQAKAAGKIRADYEIPGAYCNNTPARIASLLEEARRKGLAPVFPFGTDFTKTEQRLMPALDHLRHVSASPPKLATLLLRGLVSTRGGLGAEMERMGLARPRTLKEQAYRALLMGALAAVGPVSE